MATPRPRLPFPYNPQDLSYTILLEWWEGLATDRGERAELRRADNALRVVFSPAYHELLQRLQAAGYGLGVRQRERLAALAGLAAHVQHHAGPARSLATQMGSVPPGGAKPPVSELRFRRLLATDDLDELYTQLRRAISLLDGTANLVDLARVLWRWQPIAMQHPGDPRKNWAYDYYAVAPQP